ncbi:MAG: hypothetical protein Q9168_004706 [Polycauliona sp. 1 TL-2023]
MAGNHKIHAAKSLMSMPTEMILAVYSKLHKEDLKSVRLSCHRLGEITDAILFDRVVVTSIDDNTDLFQCVIDNPELARHVKTLVIDIPYFRGTSAGYYFGHLMKQIKHDVARTVPRFALKQPPAALLQKLEKAKWFKDPRRTRDRMELLAMFELPHDYEDYVAIRNRQTENIGTSLPLCMSVAFTKCVNVQRLEVQTEWLAYDRPLDDTLESILPRFSSSGALARRYNPLLLLPVPRPQASTGHQQVISQLLEKVKQVDHLKLGKGFVMLMNQLDTVTLLRFQHLTSLTLWIPTKLPSDEPSLVNRLTPLLRAAHNLRQLHVGANNTTKYEHADTWRRPLLPLLQGCVWPRLVSLKLTGIVATARELLTLLKNHKDLESLSLTSMDIRVQCAHGMGSEVITTRISEDLVHLFWNTRRLMNLTSLSLEPPFRTQINESMSIIEDFGDFKEKWEAFVLDPGPLDPIPGMYDFEEES